MSDILNGFLRANGLEMPLKQHRLVNAWDEVVGSVVARYTEEKSIRNQTLWVKISSPAVRAEVQMQRTRFVEELNNKVGGQVITDIRVY
jgi:predicted nucleic acid-binding Zn ribbon protein